MRWTSSIVADELPPKPKPKPKKAAHVKYKATTIDEITPKPKCAKAKPQHLSLDDAAESSSSSDDEPFYKPTAKGKRDKGLKNPSSIVDRITAKYGLSKRS